MIAALTIAVALAWQDTPTVEFRDKNLGLAFNHPKNWIVRKERLYTAFDIPTAGGVAEVQLFAATYRDTADQWQLIQREVNAGLGRTVDRQSTEEIMGVPMLVTRVQYAENGQSFISVVGLLYSATAKKMQYRLTATLSVAEEAEKAWQEALITLRTLKGNLPDTEDPNKPVDDSEPEGPKPEVVLKPQSVVPGVYRAPNKLADGGYVYHAPDGWSLVNGTLNAEGFRGTLQLAVERGGDEEARKQLDAFARSRIPDFSSIAVRYDSPLKASRSGAMVGSVVRKGAAGGSSAVRGDWVGSCTGLVWHAYYEGSESDYAADQQKIIDIVAVLFVTLGE